MPSSNSNIAYADLLCVRRPAVRESRRRDEKLCIYCHTLYPPAPRERAERDHCHAPACEMAHEREREKRGRTPRPVLLPSGNS